MAGNMERNYGQQPTSPVKPPKAVRCAIYTRKSTEDGLKQEFNSLDAQREAAEAYIASQKHEGWVALPDCYDDGGFTGGNMERPGLRRLLVDIESGRVDAVAFSRTPSLRDDPFR
jgi:site-specific DNA recombinase